MANERYVLPLKDARNGEGPSDARCSVCGQVVIDNGAEPAT
jgi:hypothetical protein